MTIIEGFEEHIGTVEYNGIVADIQRWYYGYVQHSAWCATSTSYFAYQAGVLDQLGGRNEGVYEMMKACEVAHASGRVKGKFYGYGNFPEIIPKGAVIFFQRLGLSHVAHCYEPIKYSKLGWIQCIGGNQNDSICVKRYSMAAIQAICVLDYGTDIDRPTIYKGYKDEKKGGAWCKEMQIALNTIDGANLDLDGSCGRKTDAALREFQRRHGLDVDGRCGPKTWAMIDKLMEPTEPYKVRVETDLNARSGAANTFPVVKVLREGSVYTVDRNLNGWSHIVEVNAWASAKYLTKTE